MYHQPSSLDLCTHNQKKAVHHSGFVVKQAIQFSVAGLPSAIIMCAINCRLQWLFAWLMYLPRSFRIRVALNVYQIPWYSGTGIKAITSKSCPLVCLFICITFFFQKDLWSIFAHKVSPGKSQVAKASHSPFCNCLTSTFFLLIALSCLISL